MYLQTQGGRKVVWPYKNSVQAFDRQDITQIFNAKLTFNHGQIKKRGLALPLNKIQTLFQKISSGRNRRHANHWEAMCRNPGTFQLSRCFDLWDG